MTVRAHVAYDWVGQTLALTVVDEFAGGPRILRLVDDGVLWETFDPQVVWEPSLRLPREAAEAVLEAFRRHLATTDGYVPTEARKDHLAERERVDQLLATMSRIAEGRLVELAGTDWQLGWQRER